MPGDFVQGKIWELISSELGDGAECLTLKMPSGEPFCDYVPGRQPFEKYWHSYFKGFPKKDFLSREACIRNAESIAGHPLIVRRYESLLKKAEGAD
jgi:hypothetical protein